MANFTNKWPKRIGYSALMDSRSISEAHRHHQPFIQSERGRDGGFVDVIRFHMCLEKGISHVDCSQNFTTCAVMEDVVYTRERKGVRDSVSIKLAVVANPSRKHRWVFFWYDEGWGGEG